MPHLVLFVCMLICSVALGQPTTVPAATAFQGDGFTLRPVLSVQSSGTVPQGALLPVTAMLQCTQGHIRLFNPTLDVRVGSPARLLVYDRSGKAIHDLLAPFPRESQRFPVPQDWREVSADQGPCGIRTKVPIAYYLEDFLPTGHYMLQLVYTRRLLEGPAAKLPKRPTTPEGFEEGIIMRSDPVPIEVTPESPTTRTNQSNGTRGE